MYPGHYLCYPRGAGISNRTRGAGRGKCYPAMLTPEPMVGERRARRRSKAQRKHFYERLEFSQKGHVRIQGQVKGQRHVFMDNWPQSPDYEQQRAQTLLKFF